LNSALILSIVAGYFVLLLVIAGYTARGATNESFFIGKKSSNWMLVAYGMIGTSLSGVTFISVPGGVQKGAFGYLQVVIGYFLGYFVVAFVLLPLYYRLNLTSIYTYLKQRFGDTTYKTGASFFILSRTLGASIRIFLVLNVLQIFVLDDWGVPFAVTVFVILLMILLYTYKGGVKTIIWTDTLQTTFMLLALVVTVFIIANEMNLTLSSLWTRMADTGYTKLVNTDWKSPGFFLKQFVSGALITITMTGLDQEMMQKNISIKTLGEAQKNMISFSVVMVMVNVLFLFLGGTLYLFMADKGIAMPAHSDDVFPTIALKFLPPVTGIIFIIGLISALFPSADGAITALTSSFCIDILGLKDRTDISEEEKTKTRRMVHLSVAGVFLVSIVLFRYISEGSVIQEVLKIAGFTYGPLLGLFSFGLLTKYRLKEKLVPLVCIAAPAATYVLNKFSTDLFWGYQMGFEVLLINGLITFAGLMAISTNTEREKQLI
jgi:Na+/proline symporter